MPLTMMKLQYYAASLVIQLTIYLTCSGYLNATSTRQAKESTEYNSRLLKAKSWILTGTTSLICVVGSLPFLADFAVGRDVAEIQHRRALSDALCCFFLSYMHCDLVIGCLCYRKQISLTTGWFHHIAYTFMVVYILNRDWGHVFSLALFEELPTAYLALSKVAPKFRNDYAFAGLFGLIRLLFHGCLCCYYGSAYGRAFGTDADHSGIPLVFFLSAMPLHVWWFSCSVRGIMKRKRQQVCKVDVSQGILAPDRATMPACLEQQLVNNRPMYRHDAVASPAGACVALSPSPVKKSRHQTSVTRSPLSPFTNSDSLHQKLRPRRVATAHPVRHALGRKDRPSMPKWAATSRLVTGCA